ncbi:MAG: SEC-C motif-containing protein [Pseudohongiellaceae bacterium]|jgi:SEC-C motif-containing protein
MKPPMKLTVCWCDSGRAFNRCCGPLLNLSAQPKTAKQLMRSRYTAHTCGGYGDYLLATWHPNYRTGLDAAALSMKTTNWQSLNIIDSGQDHDSAFVEFVARFLESTGEAGVHHERSCFQRIGGRWYYVDGTVSNEDQNN